VTVVTQPSDCSRASLASHPLTALTADAPACTVLKSAGKDGEGERAKRVFNAGLSVESGRGFPGKGLRLEGHALKLCQVENFRQRLPGTFSPSNV
jgi:hypothetical protein